MSQASALSFDMIIWNKRQGLSHLLQINSSKWATGETPPSRVECSITLLRIFPYNDPRIIGIGRSSTTSLNERSPERELLVTAARLIGSSKAMTPPPWCMRLIITSLGIKNQSAATQRAGKLFSDAILSGNDNNIPRALLLCVIQNCCCAFFGSHRVAGPQQKRREGIDWELNLIKFNWRCRDVFINACLMTL